MGHDQHGYNLEKELPGLDWECNLGWVPTKGWEQLYGTVVKSFEMTYHDRKDVFYVVELRMNPSPTRLMVFRDRFVTEIDEFPEKPEVLLPPNL